MKDSLTHVIHVGPSLFARGGISTVIKSYVEKNDVFFNNKIINHYVYSYRNNVFLGVDFSFVTSIFVFLCKIFIADIVHVHMSVRGSFVRKFFFCLIAASIKKPFILHVHSGCFDNFYQRSNRLIREAVEFCFKKSARIICLSANQIESLKIINDEHDKYVVVPNFIDSDFVFDYHYEPFSFSERTSHFRLLFVGKLSESKGIRELLFALKVLINDGVPIHLDVVGEGNISQWMAVAEEMGVSGSISFHGWKDNLEKNQFYASCHLFLLPSHYESFGIVILEAMLHARPVVATNVGGIPDLIQDGVNGYLVPPRNALKLAEAIKVIYKDEIIAKMFSQKSRDIALNCFSADSIIMRIVSVYKSMI